MIPHMATQGHAGNGAKGPCKDEGEHVVRAVALARFATNFLLCMCFACALHATDSGSSPSISYGPCTTAPPVVFPEHIVRSKSRASPGVVNVAEHSRSFWKGVGVGAKRLWWGILAAWRCVGLGLGMWLWLFSLFPLRTPRFRLWVSLPPVLFATHSCSARALGVQGGDAHEDAHEDAHTEPGHPEPHPNYHAGKLVGCCSWLKM